MLRADIERYEELKRSLREMEEDSRVAKEARAAAGEQIAPRAEALLLLFSRRVAGPQVVRQLSATVDALSSRLKWWAPAPPTNIDMKIS